MEEERGMKDKNIVQKIVGGISGVVFYIVFFGVSIIGGCTGGDILRLSMESDGDRGLGLLLIAILILVGLAVIFYMIDKIKAGAIMGICSAIGLLIAYGMSGADVKEIEPGGFILLVCTIVLGGVGFIPPSPENRET